MTPYQIVGLLTGGAFTRARPGVLGLAVTVWVSVVVEETQPQQVHHEPRGPDGDHNERLLDRMRLGEALDGLEQNGEAEGGEEDGVDEGAHHLGADPAERVLVGGLGALGEPHRHQRHDQRHHVRQHVEGVREHRERRREPTHHHLDHEKSER